MKIELKDLDFSILGNNVENELLDLQYKWFNIWDTTEPIPRPINFYFHHAEQIAKEKVEILSKKKEITKEDIVRLFENAGFDKMVYDTDELAHLQYGVDNFTINIIFEFDKLYFRVDNEQKKNGRSSFIIEFTDLKRIEFYYNIFRRILEFEVNKNEVE
jgi:hypothetical protein